MILNATRLWILKLLKLLQKQRDLKASLWCFKQERFFHLSRWKQKNFDTLWMTFGPTCHPLLLPRNIALWLSCRCGLSACWATGTRGTWAGHKGCENGWLKWGCTAVATLCTKYSSKTFLGGKLQLFLQLLQGVVAYSWSVVCFPRLQKSDGFAPYDSAPSIRSINLWQATDLRSEEATVTWLTRRDWTYTCHAEEVVHLMRLKSSKMLVKNLYYNSSSNNSTPK